VGGHEKGHGRIELRRLARVAVSPEEIGLVGCWQVLAVERHRQPANDPEAEATVEIGYYVTSCALDEHEPEQMAAVVRNHWSAIENGVHHRRDVTFREDAHKVKRSRGAHAANGGAPAVLATLRNLAIAT